MFAIIENGSRQYQVAQGDTLQVDYQADVQKGETISFDRVLLANGGGASVIGRPHIEGAVVEAEVLNPEVKGPKLEIQKFRRRKNSKRHTGHRQKHTAVRIKSINVPGLEVVETGAAETVPETEPDGSASEQPAEPSASAENAPSQSPSGE